MKIAAYRFEKIGSTVSGYFHPSLWLSESHRLLVPEGDKWIDVRGAAGRQQARDAADCDDDDHPDAESQRMRSGDAPDVAGQQARQSKAGHQAEENAGGDQAHAFAQNHLENVALLRAEGHANADFVRLERHGVSHDAKDADDHEQQADPGEGTERSHAKPRLGVGEPFEIASERAGVRERDVAIDGPDFLASVIEERAGIDGGPEEDAAVTKAGDRVGEKSLGHDGLLQAAGIGARADASTLKLWASSRTPRTAACRSPSCPRLFSPTRSPALVTAASSSGPPSIPARSSIAFARKSGPSIATSRSRTPARSKAISKGSPTPSLGLAWLRSVRSPGSACCSWSSASLASWLTPCRSKRTKSAFAWPSARSRATFSKWFCAKACA